MIFYLGTHKPGWLASDHFAGQPFFVSARRLRDRVRWPRAKCRWALDSGGFTELSMYGRWTLSASQYVADVRRWADEIGMPDFAAPQDWMCEPAMLAKTGKTVYEHQRLSTDNYLELRSLAPDLPFMPILQGWLYGDYFRHIEMYAEAGVRLENLLRVGVGSVCRRQDTTMAEELMRDLHAAGIATHGFGFKLSGLRRAARWMRSADSMAWSFAARRTRVVMPGCAHRNCANCARYAMFWCEKALAAAEEGEGVAPQASLF